MCVFGTSTCGKEEITAGVARGRRMGSWATKVTQQTYQLLNLSGHDFMSLPFHLVGDPGRHVLWGIGVSLEVRVSLRNPQLGAAWHQPLSSDGNDLPVELCLHPMAKYSRSLLYASACAGLLFIAPPHTSHSACFLYMRKHGLCLFVLMKIQNGAIFYTWPTT